MTSHALSEGILVLDFGSQVTQLIARRIREMGVYAEIHPCTISESRVRELAPKALILSGGPASVTDVAAPCITKDLLDGSTPVLGICYGQQLTSQLLGGKVEPSKHREYGRAFVEVVEDCTLFKGVWEKGKSYEVWMSHGDRITAIPDDFHVKATSEGAPFAAICHKTKPIYGVQFHPEVAHTPDGMQLINNFVFSVAGCKPSWNMHSFLEEKAKEIKEQVGSNQVICAVSGGVDSSVVAALLHRAIGDQLHCIFVDTGVLRKDEAGRVRTFLEKNLGVHLHFHDGSERFLSRLEGVDDPEKKRKIIGNTFIEIFEEEAAKLPEAHYLAQGTLYPDVIESISVHGGPSVTIKSHHNVGGLPERMNLKLVEPIRELFKDEVRALGEELGLSHEMVHRHPFPGPGLAIRIPGAISKEKIAILQEADAIYLEEIRKADLYKEIWQAFAVLLPVRTVGVMGDQRTYDFVCALRAVTSTDGMTADYYPFSHEFLGRVSNRIINEVKGINRVVYDVTSKPPGTIEWE